MPRRPSAEGNEPRSTTDNGSSGARRMVGRRRGERSGGRKRNRVRSDTKNATAVAKRVARSEAHRGREGSHKEERHTPTAGE